AFNNLRTLQKFKTFGELRKHKVYLAYFHALACVPQGNVVTNESYTNLDCLWDTSRGNWLYKYIFFLKFQRYTHRKVFLGDLSF
ncbi:MAG: hypothetical protein EAZ31_00600, partial [Cytophagia bacterium]